ncbi:MAG: TlpA disulfide reductase family protein [Bacteroidota bacterium]
MNGKYFFTLVMTFVASIMLSTGTNCYGQGNNFELRGDTKDLTLDSVWIQYINAEGTIVQETLPATDGKFLIKGSITEPTFSYLLFKRKGEEIGKRDVELKRVAAYLEPARLMITKLPAQGGYLSIVGSKSQQEYKELWEQTRGLKGAELNKISYAYFISYPNSYVTADRMKYFISSFSSDSIKAVYNNFNDLIKNSTDGRRLANEIKSRLAGKPGTIAFPFDIKDKDGKALSLAALKGKYVLIDFWATWCVPCRASMPHMIKLYDRYKDKNFEMIGIADDDKNANNWRASIVKDKTDLWPQALRGLDVKMFIKGYDNPRDISQQYGVRALPTKILIDPEGKIIGRYDGQHESDADLDQALETLIK